ncbi:MAG: ATP-binding protein [Akkermansiaceae bacterium]|nr:ATP-binding protein [Armatimonadota bacterium]
MTAGYLAQPSPFFNRVRELATLERAYRSPQPAGQLLLLYGRRRLGKTYLLQRFFAGAPGDIPKPHCYYLADQSTAPVQRRALGEALLASFPGAGVTPEEIAVSWNTLFRFVGSQARKAGSAPRIALILDEFPYLVDQTPELASILQSWWDREGIHSPLLIALCGSQLSAMEALGASSAPLYGRFTAGIVRLFPLGYADVAAFYAGSPLYDAASILTAYGVFGGTPRYHALVDSRRPFGEEMVRLLLERGGALENEVAFLLGSEQLRDPAPYNAVLAAIAGGETQFGNIQNASGTDRSRLSYYLGVLTDLGWVKREFAFEETSDKRALYRAGDPFLAFWYRFVHPLRSALAFSDPQALYDARIAPFLSDYMGRYVFEEICYQWLARHAQTRVGTLLESAGRWWSRDGQIEIDLVASPLTPSDGYLFGECKWSATRPIGTGVYADLLAKVARTPNNDWRKYPPRYCLFSVGGFTPELNVLASDPEERLSLVGADDLLQQSDPVTT